MISLVSLLVAAALVSQQCGFEANAQIDDSKLTMDNSLQPNVIAPPKRPRRLKKFVHIGARPAKKVERLAGERVVLECVAMGNPPPSIYWMMNGEAIQDSSDEANEILPQATVGLAQLTSKLIISSAVPGEDEYTCVAEAGVNRDVATSSVYTIPTDGDEEDFLDLQKLYLSTKPIITYNYNDLFQEMGSVAVLPCKVHSLATFQVMWQDKNERPIFGNARMRVLPSGDLLINTLLWSDMGNFTCVVKNAYGKDSANTFVYPTKT